MKPNGWEKKKMLRDVDLVDEIINLRKRLAIAEAQRDNALSVVWDLRKELWQAKNVKFEMVGGGGEGDAPQEKE